MDDVIDGKRTEMVCTKVTERMALDLLREASIEERSVSDFLFRMIRRELYGRVTGREQAGDIQGQTR